jgi:hypothetical protein
VGAPTRRVKLVGMELDDALGVFGLDRSTTWAEIRATYRALIRTVHPDVTAGPGADAARLNAAFAVLEPVYRRGVPPPPRPQSSPPAPTAPWRTPAGIDGLDGLDAEVTAVDDDGLTLVAPPDEVFLRLAAALDEIGAVTYSDADGGYLEAVVADGTGQLVISLQGRAHATEAFFTLEPMDSRPVPAIDTIVRQIATILRRR